MTLVQKILLLSLTATLVSSCQNIRVRATDGSVVVGRSMEFAQLPGLDVQTYLFSEPAGTFYTMTDLPNCAAATTFTSKYKIGRIMVDFDGVILNSTMGGINSAGMSGSTLYFTKCAKFPSKDTVTGDKCTNAIPQTNVVLWVLANYGSVSELNEDLKKKGDFTAFPYVWDQGDLGLESIPVHYAFHDADGKSIVLEYTKHGRKVYRNTVGVMTNSPEYSWHMDNLRNYPQVRRKDWPGFKWTYNSMRYKQQPFWSGTGLSGIPGDYSSPSRFIKAAAQVTNITPPTNADQAVVQAFHLMNAADIPLGIIEGPHGPGGFTWWSTVHDVTRRCAYLRGYRNLAVKRVCLNNTSDEEEERFLVDDGDFEGGIVKLN